MNCGSGEWKNTYLEIETTFHGVHFEQITSNMTTSSCLSWLTQLIIAPDRLKWRGGVSQDAAWAPSK